jgi:hypothetical protein
MWLKPFASQSFPLSLGHYYNFFLWFTGHSIWWSQWLPASRPGLTSLPMLGYGHPFMSLRQVHSSFVPPCLEHLIRPWPPSKTARRELLPLSVCVFMDIPHQFLHLQAPFVLCHHPFVMSIRFRTGWSLQMTSRLNAVCLYIKGGATPVCVDT